jgi:argininosuccinate synthase
MSHEGAELEDPLQRPLEPMFQLTKSPKDAPDAETEVSIDFEKGVPVAVNGTKLSGIALLDLLNKLGAENGIGRADLVETRTVGMKSRGVYETPAGTILYTALRELEMLCLDGETLEMKKNLANTYARLVYTGKWFTAFRVNLDAFFTSSSRYLTGEVNLVLYKGNVLVSGRQSKYSLYSEDLASFGKSDYDHHDATGFLKLYSLATGVQASVQKDWNKA